MTVRTLYFDESGFTGYNLLDSEQPIFAIASTSIKNEEALEILTKSFPKYKGSEFKFSNIWNSNYRSGLNEFAIKLEQIAGSIFVYVVDKRFAVLTKMVDFLIEPSITASGFDFYDDGFCWKYANYIYFGFSQFAPPELFNKLLVHYQQFSRNPSLENLALLQSHLSTLTSSANERVRIFLEQMVFGAQVFERYHDIDKFKSSNELQLTSMLAIVAHWRQRKVEDFAIVHDASSNFFRGREMWDRITNISVPPHLHRLGDGTYVQFPLRVVSTNARNSMSSSAIQFCDIVVGLTTRHFNLQTSGDDRNFMDSLIGAGLKNINYNGIRPDNIFPNQIPPKRLSGPDIVDQMTKIIFGP